MEFDDSLVFNWFEAHRPPVGERLPAERVLADDLGISRATLRRGLAVLEAKGFLLRQVGRGTFVQDAAGLPARILDGSGPSAVDVSPRQVMAARLVLEPSLARIAARDGNRAQHHAIEEAGQAVAAAVDWTGYDRADWDFHRSIASASGNPLLMRLLDETAAANGASSWGHLRQRADVPFARPHASMRDHSAISDAIRSRDVHEAGDCMKRHLLVEAAIWVGELV